MESNKRIEFIDLAKGVCILMLVIGHCGIPTFIPGLLNVCVPLFFVLSGIFFKTYNGIKSKLIRKINCLLVPFIFFYLFAYLCFYIANIICPNLIKTDASNIFDVFTQRQYFNGPIWFLICLFWTNIYFCTIQLYIRSNVGKLLSVLLLFLIGIYLCKKEIFLPCMMDVAMTALPFFYFGYLLKQTSLLTPNSYDKYNLLFAIGLWLISLGLENFCDIGYISLHYNQYQGNIIFDMTGAISSVMAVLFLCKAVNHLPIISYCGRYSIILLCTHHIYYRPLIVLFNKICIEYSIYLSALCTLILCIISIPICKRYIPMFCAQKDLINIKN